VWRTPAAKRIFWIPGEGGASEIAQRLHDSHQQGHEPSKEKAVSAESFHQVKGLEKRKGRYKKARVAALRNYKAA
ncbi:MAG TPA: hypothetical protein VGE39_12290, partial [Prosthecobacter sp.]